MFSTAKKQESAQRGTKPKEKLYTKQTKSLCWSHQVASHLLFQELFTGFVECAGFVGHKQILFLKGVQVLQGSADIFENGITLFLVAVQLISGFSEGGTADVQISLAKKKANFGVGGGLWPHFNAEVKTSRSVKWENIWARRTSGWSSNRRSLHQLSKAKHQRHYSWGVVRGRAGDDIQMWSGTAAAT